MPDNILREKFFQFILMITRETYPRILEKIPPYTNIHTITIYLWKHNVDDKPYEFSLLFRQFQTRDRLLRQRCKQPTKCHKFHWLIFLNQLYMFRAINSLIFRSTFLTACTAFGTAYKRSINGLCCTLLVAYVVVLMMHGLTNVKVVKISLC